MLKIFFLIIIFNLNESNENKSIFIEFKNKTWNKTEKHITKKNLIIGCIENYSLNIVLPFFKSLIYSKITNYDIVIFISKVTSELINYLKSIKVIIYKISEKYKHFPLLSLRWKLYIDFLKENKNKYNLVFHADIRDTIFQKDIFKSYENLGPFLGVAIEDGILSEKVNKKWIIDFVGEEKHKKIQKERIICFGTLWGTLNKFLDFSKILWQNLIQKPFIIDQGIGNYLIYYEKILKEFIIKSDNYGPVMTLGLTKRFNILTDNESNILNFGGEIASVIHQYDRKIDIRMSIINKYCPENLNLNNSGKKRNIPINKSFSTNHLINEKIYTNTIDFIILFEFLTIILIIKYISKYFIFKGFKSKN